jgi:hypothetical protein
VQGYLKLFRPERGAQARSAEKIFLLRVLLPNLQREDLRPVELQHEAESAAGAKAALE